ncbi:MAG: acetyl-CoA synthetase [Bacteroidetes bacterium GWF2_42_66]|nr:MAG: acetyl-CoA synthetase [Bacteroidetes bacterium GWA2_42_15]OFY02134.1 MAG: acetyl-CoA synthetase [Bacteroidetes bacterium GWE2_42_39]OFY43480.1 MAG: acetyl-CoA synthetase [Bacteroidetes bacterium GWF2_42_66]HBL76567.1 acetyl-CoA synthetase [Prolixibacteraceae bacterium]HCR91102.1 acetyl-CoA synthetase [Prolixibacteraceae bacterium]
MQLYKKFLVKPEFDSLDDFLQNFEIKIPDNFNFSYDVIDEYARLEPDKIALVWVDDQGEHIDFTYAVLKEKTDATASYFQTQGIGRGDKVMLILKRRYEFWFACLALHKIGAVAIPATHLLTDKDIIYRCDAATIKAIVCVGEETVLHAIEKAMPACPSVEKTISTGPLVPSGWGNFHQGIDEAPAFVKPELPSENDDLLFLYFTSGTTGNPKMVAHDYTYPLAHIITASFWHNVEEDGRHLTVADTGWAKAVWGKMYGQMMAGCSVFVYDHQKFVPAEMLSVIAKYKVTSFCAPPTIFRFLIREDFSSYDLSALKYCTTAGEALNPQVYETFYERTGLLLMEAFGQTETTVQLGTFPWMQPKPGSMGIPSPAYNISLVKPDDTVCEDGEQGQIVIHVGDKPPVGLFKGYYRDEALTKKAWHDGIYYTGDIAWRDEDGYYWFVGRTDDVIKSSGYRIGPFEVESALMTHPAVVECAVTGVPDEVRGQVVKATVVLGQGYTASDELALEIQDHVKKVTAPYKYPRIVEFVEALPKTISGKIRRVEIREKGK